MSLYPNRRTGGNSEAAKASDRPRYKVVLRPEPDVVDVNRALRQALKALLRRFGLRCTSIEEVSR